MGPGTASNSPISQGRRAGASARRFVVVPGKPDRQWKIAKRSGGTWSFPALSTLPPSPPMPPPADSTMHTFLPPLSLQTVYFHESDREEAEALGRQLYHLLCRPADDPLAAGVRIPVYFGVRSDMVDLNRSVRTIVIPVLGKAAYQTQRVDVLREINRWAASLPGGFVVPLLRATGWRSIESQMQPKPHLGELYGGTREQTLDAICIAAIRSVEGSESIQSARLFLSHAKVDLEANAWAAKVIHDYVARDLCIETFFDSVDLLPGEGLADQIENAQANGVFIAIRTDHYSSRPWCQAELIQAKRNGLPTLTVEMLTRGETRSGAYAGNGQTMVWRGQSGEVISAALVAWLRHVTFQSDGRRLIAAAALPVDTNVLPRAPELLDLAQEPLAWAASPVVMHPDPALSSVERALLKSANPKLSLVTPSTAYRYSLERTGESTASILDDWKIGMSLSRDPAIAPSRGLFPEHVEDITVAISRALISSGAHIAYGGDFRLSGYTHLLNDVYSSYNESLDEDGRFLHSYVRATIPLDTIPDLSGIAVHHMAHPGAGIKPLLDPPEPGVPVDDVAKALYLSDMRRVMVKSERARIIVAGAMTPKSLTKPGYGGAFPGVVEEAWRALKLGKPLYVLGGFGGAAAAVAAILRGEDAPRELTMSHWNERAEGFAERAKAISDHPDRARLKLPGSMQRLVEAIRSYGEQRLASDELSLAWNGLTRDQNFELFDCLDPIRVNALIMEGLFRKARVETGEKLRIELVKGDIRSASSSRIVAVATFEDAPLSGAAYAINELLGGAVETARRGGAPFQSVTKGKSAYDYLYLINLGPLSSIESLDQEVVKRSRELADLVRRHSFKRVSVVTFGGNSAQQQGQTVQGMLDGLRSLKGIATIEWYEAFQSRFDILKKAFRKDNGISHTMRLGSAVDSGRVTPAVERMVVNVVLKGKRLHTTVLHPKGNGTSFTGSVPLSKAALKELSEGVGDGLAGTPERPSLEQRGRKLARLMFGSSAHDLLHETRDIPIVIQHDRAAAQIPFEMLSAPPREGESVGLFPTLEGGIQRRLLLEGKEARTTPNPVGQDRDLNVLLIADPTEDLPVAKVEGRQVAKVLERLGGVNLIDLPGSKATRAQFRKQMERADVLHYAGHGFYEGPGDDQSGLRLSDGKITRRELADAHFGVRVVILNACEVGRVRGSSDKSKTKQLPASSFAEFFLASGVEALLGAYWAVADIAAGRFTEKLYECLSMGTTLNEAVLAGRNYLHGMNASDWANYVQYGDGRFRLMDSGGDF